MKDYFKHNKAELYEQLEHAISLIKETQNDINNGGKFLEARIEDLRISKHWIEGVEIKMARTLRKSK
jgi:hypothetical protein